MVYETAFASEDVPAAERFGRWCELVRRAHAPLEADSPHRADFRARLRVLSLGAVTVWPAEFAPAVLRRTPELARRHDPRTVHVSLPLRGRLRVAREGRADGHGPGSLCVVDTSRPCEMWAGDGDGPYSGIGLEVPRDLLHLPPERLAGLTRRSLSAREGMGALLAQFLTTVAADSARYRPSDGPRLAAVAVDLLSALFAHALESDHALPPEDQRRALLLRVQAHIRRHLHDPHLSPPAIAAAHHISLSHLHRLFRDEGSTVSAFLRDQRLRRIRQDLSDPALHRTPIHSVAARWGLTDPSAFSRAFRVAYGTSPSDYRQRVLAGGGTPAAARGGLVANAAGR
ncbi:helix-turn-helix domain-containing protein [Streptomyces pini]|uniref:AraC-type DNA-binding protein n=1 Tax=Streptomyces pini TaxID=1520580 RepID=A0A1I4E1L3_9ACTN|nr:helix-turn-helix domain-containing protein [Streptomyces pini]SFK98457.1 AraC-type DNA-binding protein [Streptomyces pini]